MTTLQAHFRRHWCTWMLGVIVVAAYAASLRFGLIWDDPRWYSQGSARPIWQLLTALPSYHFYRPLAIWLNQQMVSSQGIVNAPVAHGLQVAAHLCATLLTVAVWRALRADEWSARLAGLLFALHPFAFQAVAWQAPQQPIATALVLSSVLAAANYRQRHQPWLLVLSVVAYAAALLFQESALPFVFVFVWLAWRERGQARPPHPWHWLAPYVVLAVVYAVVWLAAARAPGVVGGGWGVQVLAYLLQAVAFPVMRALALVAVTPSPWAVLAVCAGVWLVLVWGLVRAGKGGVALLASVWIAAGLAPSWAGLPWAYAETGARLVYPAIAGIAALWGCWIAWLSARGGPWPRRALGAVVLLALVGASLEQWYVQNLLFQRGTRHMASTVAVMRAAPGGRLAFVNYPDRLALRPAPYPLGFWGYALAPVTQSLSDYARALAGVNVATRTSAAFPTGSADRDAWSYHVDLRGQNAGYEALYGLARWADAVYLTQYRPDGTLALAHVGEVRLDDGAPARARLGGRLELVQWQVHTHEPEDLVEVRLDWRATAELSYDDTIFVHLLAEDGSLIAGFDGDGLGGLLPLFSWQRGDLIEDWRQLPLQGLPSGHYRVTVGAYNRLTGHRHAATPRTGVEVRDDEVILATVNVGP